MIKGKQPEEIRKMFNIVNDFTPEEEAQIKKENVSSFRSIAVTRCSKNFSFFKEWAEDR